MTDALARIAARADDIAAVRAGFAARLQASAAEELRAIAADGLALPEPAPTLRLPATLERVLATALVLEDDAARREALARHYLDTMPRLHLRQQRSRQAPFADFFQRPIDWARLPRLRAAWARLEALVGGGVLPALADCPTLAALYERTHYGRVMPLLHGQAADLAFYARALEGQPLEAVVDHYLYAPLVHELTHFGVEREAVFPLYLDECIAGYLGIWAAPGFAFPAPGDDNGIYAAAWLMQVGHVLARLFGVRALAQAQAGQRRFAEVLPPSLLAALERLGWDDWWARRDFHFLSDTLAPDPWLKLFYLGAAGAPLDALDWPGLRALPWDEVPAPPPAAAADLVVDDRDLVEAGLRAMCLDTALDGQHYVVRAAATWPRLVVVDGARACVSCERRGVDPAAPAYHLPPAVARRLGRPTQLSIERLDDIPALAAQLSAV